VTIYILELYGAWVKLQLGIKFALDGTKQEEGVAGEMSKRERGAGECIIHMQKGVG